MIFQRISMRTINHESLLQDPCLFHRDTTRLDRLYIVIRAIFAPMRQPSLEKIIYPRRMTKQSSFPFVRVIAANPCFVTPRKEWPHAAARMASRAISRDPSVPFLNPIGKVNPDANSLWSWDSVVRAPIAPRDNKSAKNYISAIFEVVYTCGDIVSSISEAMGTPVWVKSQNNFREIRNPLLILKDPSISGSLMRPFQPTVVLYLSAISIGR